MRKGCLSGQLPGAAAVSPALSQAPWQGGGWSPAQGGHPQWSAGEDPG